MSEQAGSNADGPASRPRKSRLGWWIAGISLVLVLLLGTCVKGGMDAYRALTARAAETEEFARYVMRNGLPPQGDPVYARRMSITQADVDAMNRYMRQFGRVSSYSQAACSIVSSANSDPVESGTFGNCFLTAEAQHSPVNITVRWVREDDAWKLHAFNVNYTDLSVLVEKAEQLDQIANEEGGPVEGPPSDQDMD